MCRVFSCAVGREYLLWPVHSLDKTLLAIALLHSVLQGQICLFSPVQFSRSVVSNSWRPHESQHARPPCPSPSPRVHSDSRPSSQWCHPGKFGLGMQNEPGQRLIEFCQENAVVIANTLFQQHKSRLYTWTSPDGQHWNQIDYILCSQRWRSSIQSALVLAMNIQGWFPLWFTGLISLLSKGLSGVFSSTTILKHQFFSDQLSLWSSSHIHTWPLEKPWLWLYEPFLAKWCLCFLICCLGLS